MLCAPESTLGVFPFLLSLFSLLVVPVSFTAISAISSTCLTYLPPRPSCSPGYCRVFYSIVMPALLPFPHSIFPVTLFFYYYETYATVLCSITEKESKTGIQLLKSLASLYCGYSMCMSHLAFILSVFRARWYLFWCIVSIFCGVRYTGIPFMMCLGAPL